MKQDIVQGDGDIEVGTRIRQLRRLRRMTLKELALAAACSESMLSKIETGRADPSLKTLKKIVAALDTTVGDLLTQADYAAGVIIHPRERVTLPVGDRMYFEALTGRGGGHLLEAHLVRIAAGGSSGGAFRHEGEEVGYVVEGKLELTLDDEVFLAEAGDSFCFRSDIPHAMHNPGPDETRILWVNTPPTF